MTIDKQRLATRVQRLARMVELNAPDLILRDMARSILVTLGPRWFASLWYNVAAWDTRGFLTYHVRDRLLGYITWRRCPACSHLVWSSHYWEHEVDHEFADIEHYRDIGI